MVLDTLNKYHAPLRLIDEVIDQSENKISARKIVSGSEQYFQGHFPENPVIPGVLIVQAMVELAEELCKNQNLHLSKMKKVKFRQMVQPGDELIIKIILKDSDNLIFNGQAFLNEKIACSAELEFSLD